MNKTKLDNGSKETHNDNMGTVRNSVENSTKDEHDYPMASVDEARYKLNNGGYAVKVEKTIKIMSNNKKHYE
tara:strand:- start:187 stop:402 length:216 start_codon:yes stop_codon:yes gene_type:complete